jgi:cytochrome c oxidase subunit II
MRRRLVASSVMAVFIVLAASFHLMAADNGQIIKATAKKFEYSPKEIVVKKGVPVTLEFTSLDRMHGFNCPELKIRADIMPGKSSTVRFVADKTGAFAFHCDNFCGTGHEGMRGTIKVVE